MWDSITNAVQDNPTLVLLSMMAAVFVAGWAVRKTLEQRTTERLKEALKDQKSEVERLARDLAELREGETLKEKKRSKIARRLHKGYLKRTMASLLDDCWQQDLHDPLVASVCHQVLSSGGKAILWSPEGHQHKLLFEVDDKSTKYKFTVDYDSDLVKKVEEFVPDSDRVSTFFCDLSIYGLAWHRGPNPQKADEEVTFAIRQIPGAGLDILLSGRPLEKED